MDWVHETYRKIYQRSDGKWARHRASTRGLAALLIIAADEDGCIYLGEGETPADTAARVVQAHASERKQIKADTVALLEAKPQDPPFLVHDENEKRIRIRNFSAAQGIVPQTPEERSAERSSEAERAARYRKRKKGKTAERDDGRDAERDARDDRHGAERDGGRDGTGERRDGWRDENRDTERDSRAGASPGARAGAAARDPSVPSVPLPESPHTHSARGGIVVRAVSAEALVLDGPVLAEVCERIGKKLDALGPGVIWPDLDAEIADWIAHVRKERERARTRGEAWSEAQMLAELEAKAVRRMRFRPGDARKERERGRNDRDRQRVLESEQDRSGPYVEGIRLLVNGPRLDP